MEADRGKTGGFSPKEPDVFRCARVDDQSPGNRGFDPDMLGIMDCDFWHTNSLSDSTATDHKKQSKREIIIYDKETMMYQFPKPMSIKLLFILTLSTLLLLSGCNSDTNTLKTLPQIPILPGETAIRTKEFCFYIGNDAKAQDQTIVTIPEELYPQLIADPIWSMPQGIELKTANISLEPCPIEWDDGDKSYSTIGTKLIIEYEVSADTSATAGEGDITIAFENLNTLKGDYTFYIDTYTTPKTNPGFDTWDLNHVVIFKDAAEKEAYNTKTNATGILVIIVLAAVIFFAIWFIKWLSKGNN